MSYALMVLGLVLVIAAMASSHDGQNGWRTAILALAALAAIGVGGAMVQQ